MEPLRRLFNSVCAVHLLLFVFIMGLSFMVPIYTDEIAWKFVESRYFLDGSAMMYLFPQCKSTLLTQPPAWSLPVYWIQSFLYADLSQYFKLRVLGWLSFVAWITFIWRFSIRLPHLRSISSKKVLAFLLCYLGIGVLPFAMVLNRPEQTLLWGITLLTLLPLTMRQEKSNTWVKVGITFGHLLLWVTLFSIHPKILLFLPVLLVSLFLTLKLWKWRIPALIGLAFISIQTHHFWGVRTSCSEVPPLRDFLDRHMLKPQLAFSHPLEFLKQGFSNLEHVNQYLHDIDLGDEYSLNWLPPSKGSHVLYFKVLKVLLRFLEIIALVLALRWLVFLFRVPRASEVTRRAALTGSLFFSLLVYSAMQSIKNFYEISLFFPLFGLVLLLGFRKEDLKKYPKRFYAMGFFFFAFGTVSLSTLVHDFLPQARGPLLRGGYLVNQGVSVSAFHLDEQKAMILETSRLCNIPENPNHLVVDDLTYSAFASTHRPFNILNLTDVWGVGLSNLPQLLADYQSDGLVARCEALPGDLRRLATQRGEFCCIGGFEKSVRIRQLRTHLNKD